MSMLFVGLSWQKTVFVENMEKVKAAEVKSYATLKSGENYEVNSGGPFGGSSGYTPLEQAIIDSNLGITKIASLVITTDANDVKPGYIGPVDVGANSTQFTDGCHVAAYFYANASAYDAVFYADVDTIYAPEDCSFLFATGTGIFDGRCFSALKTVTFKNFDTSKVTTMYRMFSCCMYLESVNGLNTFKTPNLKDADGMFANCYAIEEVVLSSFDFSNFDNGYSTIVYYITGGDGHGVTTTSVAIKIIYVPKFPVSELKTHIALSPETSQYLVVGIAGFSLMTIFGYYLLQKKKYAR